MAVRTHAHRAAWIAARIRSGDLPRVKAAIAAHAGDAVAHAFFPGMPFPSPPTNPRELSRWARRLRRFGPEVELRAIVAMVEHAYRCAKVRVDPETEARLDAAAAWVDHPMPPEREVAAKAAGPEPGWVFPDGSNMHAVDMAAWACAAAAAQERRGAAHWVASQAIRWVCRVEIEGAGVAALHAAACAGLLGWALE